jgi:CheY-like chemotaxis protein
LSVIVGYAHLVNRALAGGPLTSKMDEIVKASERAAALTRQLLAFARKQVLVTEVLDVVAIVSELGGMLRRLIGEDIEIVTSLRANNARTRADRSQLEQVIVNLVVNARDALPNGGRVTVEVDEATLGAAYGRDHAAVRPGSYVVLAVSDNGVGMSPQVRDRVFEPFFTTKEMGRGTGLGLATVYGIVKQSGGFIWVYSEPGQGTTFKVYLPLEHAPEAPGPRIKPPARGCETVLLVEDEDAVRELAVEVLQDAGYRVLQAPSAARAIEMAGEHPGAIDLVVTDVVMPGLGGRELGEQLVASRPGLKVLFMSGYTDDVILRRGVLSSSAAFIEKPFSPEGLARKVREVLDGGPHRGETGRAS